MTSDDDAGHGTAFQQVCPHCGGTGREVMPRAAATEGDDGELELDTVYVHETCRMCGGEQGFDPVTGPGVRDRDRWIPPGGASDWITLGRKRG